MVQYLRFMAFFSCLFGPQKAVHSQLPVIVNGGFESGFAGWTRADQIGSDGTFFLQNGTSSPVNVDPVPMPPQGSNAAMTDAGGPGAHILYQDFVATGSSGLLRFTLFLGNRTDRYATPATLDFATPALNQQARVDILRPGVDPFNVAAADILLTLYRSQVGDPLINGYFTVTSDIGTLLASHSGQTLRLRFAVTDNIGPFQLGVDNVRIEAEATPVIFYSKSSGDLHNVLTWGANPDGSGPNPADFGADKTFQLANRPGIYTLTANWTVGGTLNIPAASRLEINSFILNIATFTGTGFLSGTPASTLFVSQPSSGGTSLNFLASANDLGDLIIESSATTTITAPLDVFNLLFVSNGGTLNTSNALTLKSTAANTARVGPVAGNIIGNVTVERFIPARRAWRILSAPVGGGQTINSAWQEGATTSSANPDPNPGFGTHITEGSPANGFDHNPLTAMVSIKRYVSATNSWVPLANTNATAVNNDAYMVFVRGHRGTPLGPNTVPATNTTLRSNGPLKTGDQTFAVSPTGFTAIPNPFASNINFATITRNNVQNNFYVWDPKVGGSNGVGGYVTVSFNGATYDVSSNAVSPESQFIQSGQGFLVHPTTTGVAGSLTIKENDKVNTPSTDVFRIAGGGGVETRTTAPVFEDPTKGQGLRLKLLTADEDKTMAVLDEVFASYKNTYSNEVDQWDAEKASNIGENLGMVREGRTLVIERKPLPKERDVIALKLWNTKPQTYALEINPVHLAGTGLTAFVEDKYTKTSTPVNLDEKSQLSFTVTRDPASARIDRFSIVLTRKAFDAITSLTAKSQIAAYPNPLTGQTLNLVFTNQKQGLYQVTMTNSAGQMILKLNVQHPGGTAVQAIRLPPKLTKGVFQVTVTGKEGEATALSLTN